jgi:hypothetical protein
MKKRFRIYATFFGFLFLTTAKAPNAVKAEITVAKAPIELSGKLK